MDNNPGKYLRLLAVLFGMVIVASVLITVWQSSRNRPEQALAVPSTFASADAFGTNSLVFSNGQALESYNYTSGQASPLSQNVGLNTVDTISVSGSYIVFHDERAALDGSLAAQLQSLGRSTSLDYWWVFDSQKHTFQPLPQNTLLAKVYNGNVYALQYGGSGESIATYQLPGLQRIKSISISGSSDFFATSNGFLLQSPDNKVLLTKDGTVSQVLLNSTTLVGVTADGQFAMAVTSQGDARDLVRLNLQTDKTTVIASNIVNLPVWLDSGGALYANNQGQLFDYDLATGKNVEWRLGGNLAKSDVSNIKLVALVGPNAAVVNDGANNYYLVGKNLAPVKSIQ